MPPSLATKMVAATFSTHSEWPRAAGRTSAWHRDNPLSTAVGQDPAKGGLGWTNAGESSLDARPHLCPLPQERISPVMLSVYSTTVRPIQPLILPKTRGTVSPSPWGEGRDEGGRETIQFGRRVSGGTPKTATGTVALPISIVAADVSPLISIWPETPDSWNGAVR